MGSIIIHLKQKHNLFNKKFFKELLSFGDRNFEVIISKVFEHKKISASAEIL